MYFLGHPATPLLLCCPAAAAVRCLGKMGFCSASSFPASHTSAGSRAWQRGRRHCKAHLHPPTPDASAAPAPPIIPLHDEMPEIARSTHAATARPSPPKQRERKKKLRKGNAQRSLPCFRRAPKVRAARGCGVRASETPLSSRLDSQNSPPAPPPPTPHIP